MRLFIDRDFFDAPKPPKIYLCNTSKKIIGELPAFNQSGNFKWNSYSDISFEISRTYVDLLTGETKVHPLYDKVEAPRNVLLQNYGYFAIQDVDDESGDNDIKTVSCFSLEYTASNKYLNNWHINTGEVDSKEVLYNEEQYGIDYSTDKDSFYQLAHGDFDPYESYYKQQYVDNTNYLYERVQIKDAQEYYEAISKNTDDSAQSHEKLYMKKFANVQFYNPHKQGLSLLHLVFENIPEWKIGNVDQSLWHRERKFSEDRISVYDFIQNNIHETFGCVAVWNSFDGTVSFYEEVEDDDEQLSEVSTRFETDVFISKENLASQVNVKYSSDNIKTKLIVNGADDLNIREVNLGNNAIMDLSFYHTFDWMEQDLFDAYGHYLDALREVETGLDEYGLPSSQYPMSYAEARDRWVAASNRYQDLVNAVPVEGNVVLIGDEFKKLYCTFSPISTAYCQTTINSGVQYVATSALYLDEAFTKPIKAPTETDMYVVQGVLLIYSQSDSKFKVDMAWDAKKFALIKKLNQYHVDEDINANKQDNVLLKLKNSSSDIATIRIYDKRFEASTYDARLQYYTKDKDGKYSDNNIVFTDANDFNTQKAKFAKDGTTIWANDYYVQSIVVKASNGISEAPDEYPIIDWIKGELTAQKMELEGYNITYIGTMGAYFVLAKDETNPDNLRDYGIRLLEEKHKTYTTIFQAQTEAMFSQENAQCIVQDDQPEGDYTEGTRWLDTNSNPVILKEYNGAEWITISASVGQEDKNKYEDYQRYIDNYEKLVAVQSVLSEKERDAEYCLDGYAITDYVLNLDDGSSMEEKMYKIAKKYFDGHSITRFSMNTKLPLYTFATSFDPLVYSKNSKAYNPLEQYYIKINYIPIPISNEEEFRYYDGSADEKVLYVEASQNPVTYTRNIYGYNSETRYYLKNMVEEAYRPIEIEDIETFNTYNGMSADTTLYVVSGGHLFSVYMVDSTPYIAYSNARGIYNMIMEYMRDKIEMNKFFTEDQWIRLSPFIKEDEFNDSNFLLTSYESEEERIHICQELMDAAAKELKTLCKPSLEFSMTMANILALPEFEPLFDQFQLGNFIKVQVREGYIKRARLLEVHLNFSDLSDFSCTFGNLITAKSEIDKHADLMKQAINAGKTVATSSGNWQKTVEKTNKLAESIANGLAIATVEVGKASGQSIIWDERGIWGRKLIEGTTDQYEPEQFKLVNNRILFSNDAFVTSKSLFGEYTIDGVTRWGVMAEAIDAGSIRGCAIEGGTIKIGQNSDGTYAFEVRSDGTVSMGGGSTLGGISVSDLNNAILNTNSSVTYTSQPSKYKVGDLWVLADGEQCGDFGAGSILRAIGSSDGDEFAVSHWTDAIEDTTSVIRNIKESFTWDNTGIQVAKRVTDGSGNVSTPFYVHIDSGRMGFHSRTINNDIVSDVEVVHIGNNSSIIQNATFEGLNGTTFNNDVRMNEDVNHYGAINMYNEVQDGFAWQVESDGSLSLAVIG